MFPSIVREGDCGEKNSYSNETKRDHLVVHLKKTITDILETQIESSSSIVRLGRLPLLSLYKYIILSGKLIP